MKQAPTHLQNLIIPVIEGLGYECVGIEYNAHPQHGMLRIYIDNAAGIIVEDCTKVSHQISGVLDVEDPIQGNYQLEVSSPGTERPLFTINHFQRFIGKKVQVNLFKPIDNRRKITGEIVTVVDQIVSVQELEKVIDIPFNAMSKAHLIADYLIK